MDNNPNFKLTTNIINTTADICELVGRLFFKEDNKFNRIRAVHGTVAIEQNTLSLDEVNAVIKGHHILAPLDDIIEVKNAYKAYEQLDNLDPYSVDDLLKAHGFLTQNLVEESGVFRSCNVGVVDGRGKILHLGALPQYVPSLISELLDWVKTADIHILIRSCIFHYELELIHPFADGNGRVGRLWQTLLLSKWAPIFSSLPIEAFILDHLDEYYSAINKSNASGDCTSFIEYMLSIIREALLEAASSSDKTSYRDNKIQDYLKTHDVIMNADVRKLLGVSPATANRILANLVQEDKLIKFRKESSWAYKKEIIGLLVFR